MRGSQGESQLTTSNNAYSGRSSDPVVLAPNWQPEDSASSYYTASYPSPQPISPAAEDTVLTGFDFPAQPTSDVYAYATSSLDGYKYHHSEYSGSLLEIRTSHFMNPEPPETMQTPPVSSHPSPNDTAMSDQHSRKRSHSVMSAEQQDFTQQMIAAATVDSVDQSNDAQPESRSGSVLSGGGEAEGYSPRGSRAFKRDDPPKNENGKYVCDYSEDCREFAFDRKCEWR